MGRNFHACLVSQGWDFKHGACGRACSHDPGIMIVAEIKSNGSPTEVYSTILCMFQVTLELKRVYADHGSLILHES